MRFKCKLSRSQDTHRTVIDELYSLIPNIWLNKFFKINKNPKQNFQGQFEREADTPLSSYIRQKNRIFKCFQKICLPTLNLPSVSPSVSSKDALSSHFLEFLLGLVTFSSHCIISYRIVMSNMNLSNFHEIACLEGRHGTCMVGCTVNAHTYTHKRAAHNGLKLNEIDAFNS